MQMSIYITLTKVPYLYDILGYPRFSVTGLLKVFYGFGKGVVVMVVINPFN